MPKGVREIQEDSDADFMGAAHADSDAINAEHNPWVTSKKQPVVTFKIDTGTDVTLISDTDYNEESVGPLPT